MFLKSAAARRSTFCINRVIIWCEFGNSSDSGHYCPRLAGNFFRFPNTGRAIDFTTHSVARTRADPRADPRRDPSAKCTPRSKIPLTCGPNLGNL
eukprot:7170270-Prymnesium_polylepis.1